MQPLLLATGQLLDLLGREALTRLRAEPIEHLAIGRPVGCAGVRPGHQILEDPEVGVTQLMHERGEVSLLEQLDADLVIGTEDDGPARPFRLRLIVGGVLGPVAPVALPLGFADVSLVTAPLLGDLHDGLARVLRADLALAEGAPRLVDVAFEVRGQSLDNALDDLVPRRLRELGEHLLQILVAVSQLLDLGLRIIGLHGATNVAQHVSGLSLVRQHLQQGSLDAGNHVLADLLGQLEQRLHDLLQVRVTVSYAGDDVFHGVGLSSSLVHLTLHGLADQAAGRVDAG